MIKHMHIHTIIWFLLMLALLVIPFGNVLRFDLGNGITFLALDIIVGLIFAVQLPLVIRNWSQYARDPVLRAMLVFVAIALFSLMIRMTSLPGVHWFISLLYLMRFVSYASLLIVFSYLEPLRIQVFMKRLLGAGLFTAVLGLMQYIFYPDLRNLFYLGWDEHVYRLFGTFLDPNFSGAFFVLMLGLLTYKKILYTHSKWFIVFFSVVLGSSIALTYSRSTYVMLFISFITYYLLYTYKNLKAPTRLLKKIWIVVPFGILILILGGSSEGTNLLRTASINARLLEYHQAVEIWQSAPLFGVGFNAYRYAQLHHGFLNIETGMMNHAGAGVPNSLLFVLATTGIVGFAAYVKMWFEIAKKLLTTKSYHAIALLTGLMVHAFFENSLFYPYIMFVIFVLISERMFTSRADA